MAAFKHGHGRSMQNIVAFKNKVNRKEMEILCPCSLYFYSLCKKTAASFHKNTVIDFYLWGNLLRYVATLMDRKV